MAAFVDSAKAKKVTAKVLDDMEMCSMIDMGRIHILRVWRGWIYYSFEASKVVSAVFVPQVKSQQTD